jgi:hypothetical protein
VIYHVGLPELRERPDLANPIYLGKEGGTPVVFWSRKLHADTFQRGETIQALLASRRWRLDRSISGVVRFYKDLRRHRWSTSSTG